MAAPDTTFAEPGIRPKKTDGRDSGACTQCDDEPTTEGAFAADGVDLTVIRWMLDRSPEERLQAAQELIDAASAMRGDED